MKNFAKKTIYKIREKGTFVGRCIKKDVGPVLFSIDENGFAFDISTTGYPTLTHLLLEENPEVEIHKRMKDMKKSNYIDHIDTLKENSFEKKNNYIISPVDIQSIKAVGVTFIKSLLERVVEEQSKGDPKKSLEFREKFFGLGQSIS
jgi:fumarylacetoacetate (FAA) hydrolase family protein